MLSKRITFKQVATLLFPDIFQVRATMEHLEAHKVLCLSDTDKVFLSSKQKSKSIAVNLGRQMSAGKGINETSPLELTQADCSEFNYSSSTDCFGAHLPQNKNEARREYLQIDNSEFKASKKYDLILGRGLLCCCEPKPISCGGIAATYKDQQKFINSLLVTDTNLIVLSANLIADSKDDHFFLKGKQVLLETCRSIALFAPDYDVIFGDNLVNNISKGGENLNLKNSGYVLILAKKSVFEIVNLPKDAIRFSFEESAADLPERLILKRGASNGEEIKSFVLNTSQQKELHNLRDIFVEDITRTPNGRAVYEVSCDHLKKLKEESSGGFRFFAHLLNFSTEQLSTLICPFSPKFFSKSQKSEKQTVPANKKKEGQSPKKGRTW